jgi:hypothetical protein
MVLRGVTQIIPALSFALIAIASMIAVVEPGSNIAIYLSLTEGMDKAKKTANHQQGYEDIFPRTDILRNRGTTSVHFLQHHDIGLPNRWRHTVS